VCRSGDGGIGAAMCRAMRQFLAKCEVLRCELEGRPICFGVVLGMQGCYSTGRVPEPLRLESLHEQLYGSGGPTIASTGQQPVEYVHLLEPPGDRWRGVAVLLRDGGTAGRREDSVNSAASKRRLAHAERHPLGSRAASYAYLTHANPGTVAAVVGPFAEVRLFANGKLIAFRDGKGWATLHGESCGTCCIGGSSGSLARCRGANITYARPGLSWRAFSRMTPLATVGTWTDARKQKLVAALSDWEPAIRKLTDYGLRAAASLEPTQDGRFW